MLVLPKSEAWQDEAQLILEAFRDYNKLFSKRFGNDQVLELNNRFETMSCPSHVFSGAQHHWKTETQHMANEMIGNQVTKCFFYAYSHHCVNYFELKEGGEEPLPMLLESFRSMSDFVTRTKINSDLDGVKLMDESNKGEPQGLMGKIGATNIVCAHGSWIRSCHTQRIQREGLRYHDWNIHDGTGQTLWLHHWHVARLREGKESL